MPISIASPQTHTRLTSSSSSVLETRTIWASGHDGVGLEQREIKLISLEEARRRHGGAGGEWEDVETPVRSAEEKKGWRRSRKEDGGTEMGIGMFDLGEGELAELLRKVVLSKNKPTQPPVINLPTPLPSPAAVEPPRPKSKSKPPTLLLPPPKPHSRLVLDFSALPSPSSSRRPSPASPANSNRTPPARKRSTSPASSDSSSYQEDGSGLDLLSPNLQMTFPSPPNRDENRWLEDGLPSLERDRSSGSSEETVRSEFLDVPGRGMGVVRVVPATPEMGDEEEGWREEEARREEREAKERERERVEKRQVGFSIPSKASSTSSSHRGKERSTEPGTDNRTRRQRPKSISIPHRTSGSLVPPSPRHVSGSRSPKSPRSPLSPRPVSLGAPSGVRRKKREREKKVPQHRRKSLVIGLKSAMKKREVEVVVGIGNGREGWL